MVIGLAVRSSIAFEEVPSSQLFRAVGTCEVFRMPSAAQRRYHLLAKNYGHYTKLEGFERLKLK